MGVSAWMRGLVARVALLAMVLAASVAVAAPSPTSEVEVRADPGPALWVVTRGASELVILGTVSPLPANGPAWSRRRLADALRGARSLLLSPGSVPGLAWAEGFTDAQRYYLGQPIGRTLAKELDASIEEGVRRRARLIQQPGDHYDGYRPGPAGMLLLEDSWRARSLDGGRPDLVAIDLARREHVRVQAVDPGGALPLIDAMPSMTRAEHLACLDEALDRFDWEGAHAVEVARDWAEGDVEALRLSYRASHLCMNSIPGGADRRRRAQIVWLRALEGALTSGGRTVALMDVGDLLEPSEILTALREEGAVVTEPRREAVAADRIVAGGRRPVQATGEVEPSAELPAMAATAGAPVLETPPGGSAGRAVDLSAEAPVCLSEASTGSLLTQTLCRSAAEWKEIHKARERQADALRKQRATGHSLAGAPPPPTLGGS